MRGGVEDEDGFGSRERSLRSLRKGLRGEKRNAQLKVRRHQACGRTSSTRHDEHDEHDEQIRAGRSRSKSGPRAPLLAAASVRASPALRASHRQSASQRWSRRSSRAP
eukprot:6176898-Pleurochrysis_carterae.AAC.1